MEGDALMQGKTLRKTGERTIEALEQIWSTVNFDPACTEWNEKGTLISTPTHHNIDPYVTLNRLPEIAISSENDAQERPLELHVQETLGEGGMGVVRLAVQVPLHREVAVKQIRPEQVEPKTQISLLREAWITGMLQHPNVVPVHTLGRDANGIPMFVMQRIEGVSWSDVMATPDAPIRQHDSRDHLKWNIDILMQVCNAVSFAHDKGIIHRDLKPENVMIGAFGEVYLLDWGIAVSLKEKDGLPLPMAKDIQSISGTPGYMAPEMAAIQTDMINQRTDVYQLGAILHEILTGYPRHLGDHFKEVMLSVFLSAPFQYDASVPTGLQEICHRAMHVNPEERFESVEAFRQALAQFLNVRSSVRLANNAQENLERLVQLTEIPQEAQTEDHAIIMYSIFGECRFGFQQSLREWSANTKATEGLQRSLETMIRFELTQQHAQAASVLLAELPKKQPALEEEIDALRAELQRELEKKKELEKLEFDVDLSIGRRTRSFSGIIIALITGPVFLPFGKLIGFTQFTYTHFYAFACSFVSVMLILMVWARDTMSKTAINRRIVMSMWVLGVTLMMMPLTGQLIGIPVEKALFFMLISSVLFTGMWSALLDPWMLLPTLFHFSCLVLALMWPRYLFEWLALTYFGSALLIVYVWRPDTFIQNEQIRRRLGLE
tara:strand:+ start:3591 stop:5582 length:1992 start_codon:yes stop_codon:yes gene_type:complete